MHDAVNEILAQIELVVLGKPHQCKLALACLLAKGHLLIEDLPGMGKTSLAHALASTTGLSYQRVQFTSDLLPGDITGVSIFNPEDNTFVLHKGPLFNQIVLADEVNRASPKTQSALLEAMAENQVSIDGTTYVLPKPFFVIATQNPSYHSGTYPLPESQLDRFMMRISLGFPNANAERKILLGDYEQKPNKLSSVGIDTLKEMQKDVSLVNVSEAVVSYVIALCHVTRTGDDLNSESINCNPLSPRAAKSLLNAAKAWAYIHNRDYVLPDDIQAVFEPVCEHRIELNTQHNKERLSQKVISMVDVLNPLGV